MFIKEEHDDNDDDDDDDDDNVADEEGRKLRSSACMQQQQALSILTEVAVRIAKERRNNLDEDSANLYPGGWATSVVDVQQ